MKFLLTIFVVFLYVTASTGAASTSDNNEDDKAILLEIMPILNGPGPLSSCFDGWLSNSSISNFSRVIVRQGRAHTLFLVECGLRGALPAVLPSALEVFHCARNRLSGTLLPSSSWAPKTPLTFLDVSHNDLEGRLPVGWYRMTALWWLSVTGNQLSGQLPEEWKALKSLVGLFLSFNSLAGDVPEAWGSSLVDLETVVLESNSLTATTGSFPPESWASMSRVRLFLAANNSISDASFPLPVARAFRGAKVVDIAGNCIKMQTEVLDMLLTGGSNVTGFDATPGTCLEMQPLVTKAQLSGPYSFSLANGFKERPQQCQENSFYGARSLRLNIELSRSRKRVVLQLQTDTDHFVDLFSSCVSVLYRPYLECFIDAEARHPCDPTKVRLPPWHGATAIALSTGSDFIFTGLFDALHGAHYRYGFTLGINFFPGFLIRHQLANFTNMTAHTALFDPPSCIISDTFAVNLSTSCAPCPDLARCNGTTSLVLSGGTPAWRPAEHLLPLVACPDRFTRGCRVNRNETADFHSGATCRDNFIGPLCTRCSDGYGMNSDRECTECPSRAASITLFCLSTAMLILLTMALVVISVKPKRRNFEDSVGEREADSSCCCGSSSCAACCCCGSDERKAQLKSIGRRGVVVLRQLVNHVSLIGALRYSSGSVILQGALHHLLGLLDGTNSFLFSSFVSTSLSCLNSDWSPTAARFVSLLVVFGVVFVLVSLFFFVKTRCSRTAVTVGLFLSFLAYAPLTIYVTKLLSVCSTFHFYLASEYAEHRHHDPSEVSYSLLSSDLAQDCNSDVTIHLRGGAVATLVLFSIGLPVASCVAYKMLASKPEARREVFLFLAGRYHASAWYFEIVVINGRKFAVAFIMGALSAESQSALQLQLYTAVCAVVLALSVGIKPLQRNASNVVDQMSLSSAILAAAFISAVTTAPDDAGLQITAAVVIVSTQVVVIVAIFAVGFEWVAAPSEEERAVMSTLGLDSPFSPVGVRQPLLLGATAPPSATAPHSELGTIDNDGESIRGSTHQQQQQRVAELEKQVEGHLRQSAAQREEIERQRVELEKERRESLRWKAECEQSNKRAADLQQQLAELQAQDGHTS